MGGQLDRQQDLVLAEEPGQGEDPRQGKGAHGKREAGVGQAVAQAAEPPHVDHVAHRVHDAAGREEQQCLEECVCEQVEHARHDRELGDIADAGPSAMNM